ncbi:MAG: penicillin-binding protein 1C [Bacteroidia bacterium]|nr:penicillin-binding protein 1C [Bacteroidia bacterium]
MTAFVLKWLKKFWKWGRFGLLAFLVYFIFCLPNELFTAEYSTVVEDQNGQVLMAHIAGDGQWRFPPSDSIPVKFKTALIEFEDRRFEKHLGVSLLAIGRAMVQNIRSKRVVSGGSTLSMQVIRMSRNRKGRRLIDKLREMVMALRLETRYSKEEILGLHAAHAPFGGNVVGLEAASWRYFGHSAHRLSWAESATLAVLPNAPSLMHLGKNRQALKNKRNRLLGRLLQHGRLTQLEYETAISEPLPEKPKPLPQLTPHYLAYQSMQGKSGTRIKSTLSYGLQQGVQNVVGRNYEINRHKRINNLSVVVLNVKTSEVLAYVGNTPCGEQDKNHVDIVQAPRSTGSILKPFLYAKAMDFGAITPNMLLPDYPTRINGYSPQNYEDSYDGMVPASEALARSLNIPAVRLLSEYGVTRFKQNLEDLGLTTLFRPAEQYGLSLILGGAEATLWDLAHAYANLSRSAQPSQSEGSVSPSVAFEILEAMSAVNRPSIEMYWNRFDNKQRIAWKTGTSYGARDAWAIGVTQDYVVAVWAGNATGEGVTGMTGSSTAAPVMFEVFQLLPRSTWYTRPNRDMKYVSVCRSSGQRKGIHCDDVEKRWLPNSCLSSHSCVFHQSITVSKTSGERVFATCETPANIERQPWFVLPTAAENYYKIKHPDYSVLPDFKTGCQQSEEGLEILYPLRNSVIKVPKLLNSDKGHVIFEAVHRQEDAELFWYIDERFITTTKDIHQVNVQPKTGTHVLTITDGIGHKVKRQFRVI